jgi:sulfur relay (sulfurtransferase) DsrC/TusE family protein
MIENMRNVEKDLKDFLVRLAQWTKDIAPELEKQVVKHFAKNMHIEI